MTQRQVLLTVIGKDRPGIISTVTGILFKQRCNLEDISMTILENAFSMMMVVSLPPGRQAAVQKAFQVLEKKAGLCCYWKSFVGRPKRGEAHAKDSVTHLITAVGRDRTGIVYKISQTLAGFGLNITDLNSRILGQGQKAVYAMALEVDIPERFAIPRLEKTLGKLQKTLGIEIQLKSAERLEL